MPRYALTLEYDGGGLVGWQRQANGPSVQQALEEAAGRLEGAGGPSGPNGAVAVTVAVEGAGRTDAGVHALGQVAHVDFHQPFAEDTVRDALNFHLKPAAIAVLAAARVADDFHARFSAVRRHYLYRILDRRAPPVLDRHRVWHVPTRLEAEAMDQAAQGLVGHHDFTSFRSVQCQSPSPEKTLDRLEVRRVGEEVQIVAEARSFLHNQVRVMAGTLKLVGTGKWTADRVVKALRARNRQAAGPTAPPQGLYLLGVDY